MPPERRDARKATRPLAWPKGARAAAADRRAQLVEVASRILTEQGAEALQVTTLAERANVSRPLVYRVFPTREALFRAVLEDFIAAVNARFHEALVAALPGTVTSLTIAFVEASCDVIEERGAGPWLLLDARGVGEELAGICRDIFKRLLEPWRDKLVEFTGMPEARVENRLWILASAGRAALFGWIDGTLSRSEAVADAISAISALLAAFALPGSQAASTLGPGAAKPVKTAKTTKKPARSRPSPRKKG
ncbi:MAG: TetR/AcrR family transcriptional regulator [Polyangiaceae bacterium]